MIVTVRAAGEVEIDRSACLQADGEQRFHGQGSKTGEPEGVREAVICLLTGKDCTLKRPAPVEFLMKVVVGKDEGLSRTDGGTPSAAGALLFREMDLDSGNGQGPCRAAVRAPAAVEAAEPPAQTSAGNGLNGLAAGLSH